jgi:hypothetical protein
MNSKTNKNTILSCPCCGEKAIVYDSDMDHAVSCIACPCEVSDWTKTIEELIDSWNTRSQIKSENEIVYESYVIIR